MNIYSHVPNFLSPKFHLNTVSSFNSNHRDHLIHSNIFAMIKQRHQRNFIMFCARNVKSINCYAVKNNFFNCFVNFLCLLNAAEINSLNWSLYQKRDRISLGKNYQFIKSADLLIRSHCVYQIFRKNISHYIKIIFLRNLFLVYICPLHRATS